MSHLTLIFDQCTVFVQTGLHRRVAKSNGTGNMERQRQKGNRTVQIDNKPLETGVVPALTALHSRVRRKGFCCRERDLPDLENRCVNGRVIPAV